MYTRSPIVPCGPEGSGPMRSGPQEAGALPDAEGLRPQRKKREGTGDWGQLGWSVTSRNPARSLGWLTEGHARSRTPWVRVGGGGPLVWGCVRVFGLAVCPSGLVPRSSGALGRSEDSRVHLVGPLHQGRGCPHQKSWTGLGLGAQAARWPSCQSPRVAHTCYPGR